MTARPGRRSRIIAILFLFSTGCSVQHATSEQCALILDKIVEIELAEQGFHDPALALRKKAQLRSRFLTELQRCQERPLLRGALACVSQAKSSEEISHTCLH